MSGFWSDILGGAAQAGTSMAGFDHMMDYLGNQQAGTSQAISDLTGTVQETGAFNPYSVSSNVGSTTYGDDGSINMGLSEDWQGYSDAARGNANNAWGASNAAMTNVTDFNQEEREKAIYDRSMNMMQPEWERQNAALQEQLYNQGRLGTTTDAYGGTPEQLAMAKAQMEAQNSAAFGAMNQAQQEYMNAGNMAANMAGIGANSGTAAMTPWNQQMAQAGFGQNMTQLGANNNMQMAQLIGELGLGGITTDMNYSNIMANLQGNQMASLAGMAGGFGSSVGGIVDDMGGWGNAASGLWDTVSGWF